tara:strand:- start:1419 stop:2261 length:843 start_codon:yes stop_codon:yes gene_type:complete
MIFSKNNYLIIGYQTASLKNLVFFLKIKKKKIKFLNFKHFKKPEIEKKSLLKKSKLLDKIKRLSKKFEIILGTSEKKLEINLANFFYKNKITYNFYIDSNINLKKRFVGLNNFPKNILCINKLTIDKMKYLTRHVNSKINFFDLRMPYQNFLKKKFSKLVRKDINLLYLSSNKGIRIEEKIIKMVCTNFTRHNKIFIKIHPRENINDWKKKIFKDQRIKLIKNIDFYNDLNIRKVFGIDTMGIVNYKFAGFEAKYLKSKYSNKSFLEFFKKYNIKCYDNI